jgi:hypothetical protein
MHILQVTTYTSLQDQVKIDFSLPHSLRVCVMRIQHIKRTILSNWQMKTKMFDITMRIEYMVTIVDTICTQNL